MPDIWMKSSYSDAQHTCVEVAVPTEAPATIRIRDSKNPSLPPLHLHPSTWTAFLHEIHSGRTGECREA
ncbi:DUF397 domain-containing protein [Streptomyces sp. NPDC008001]|uniref:DUF397 domain-containing protein n=1 Tax=Streptomyces sp. NPDC008001 TaxID=3364804 RepID=UPI0036E1EC13